MTWELRCRFNRERFYPRLQAGQLTEKRDVNLAPPEAQQPPGTLSESVDYYQGNEHVANVHQYRLISGQLGAGGRPDPKWFVVGEIEYRMNKGKPHEKDASLYLPFGFWRFRYGDIRRAACRFFGPKFDSWVGKN
jgi:hypothetical protein